MFTVSNLSVLAYAQGFTLWHYKAPNHPLYEVMTSGYFDDADDLLNTGDMVMVSAMGGGTVSFVSISCPGVVLVPLV